MATKTHDTRNKRSKQGVRFNWRDVRTKDLPKIEQSIRKRGYSRTAVQRIEKSAKEVTRRRSLVPNLAYDQSLPIAEHLDRIEQLVRNHRVVIVSGETGSGKTTQIPLACLRAGFGVRGMIGHTQPRRLAARTIAERIATQTGVSLGDQIGYAVRFSEQWGENTLVKIQTDGLLLTEIRRDRHLSAYDMLIIDEAHERSLNVDFLLGYVKKLIELRSDLHVVITSATIDVNAFSQHFNDAPVVVAEGRGYPVEIRYRPKSEEQTTEHVLRDVLEEVATEKRAGARDILMFLSGEREILEWSQWVRRQFPNRFEVLPLYARLPRSEQQRIFLKSGRQRLLLSTNVAETSITVPNIRYVIDLGDARINRYSAGSKIQRLLVEPVSQASADQRAGRCGRVAPGVCYRIYDEADYAERPKFTDAEILRSNLAAVVLQMRLLRFGAVLRFPFIDPPDEKLVRDAESLLTELGALENGTLTRSGQTMAHLPIDPRLARMIVEANRLNSLNEVLVIVSALSVQDPRVRPLDRQSAADGAHQRFDDPSAQSDFVSILSMWRWLETNRLQLSRREFSKLMERSFIAPSRYFEWRSLHRQLLIAAKRLRMQVNRKPADLDSVHRAVLAGSLSFIGLRSDQRTYLGSRGLRFQIFPGSSLAKKSPKWVVAESIVETRRTYARTVAAVKPRWIEEAAGPLLKHSYTNPAWDSRRNEAVIECNSTLYGLRVVANRRVRMDSVDPSGARDLFIKNALVAHSDVIDEPFVHHNRALLAELTERQAKHRRADLAPTPGAQVAFFDERIPSEVTGTRSFMDWFHSLPKERRSSLHMTEEDLSVRDMSVQSGAFPADLDIGSSLVPLKYSFQPGSKEDGVSVQLTLESLAALHSDLLDWFVPGFFAQKCEALVRALPKRLRKQLTPIPERLPDIVARLTKPSVYRRGSYYGALTKAVKELFDISVHVDEWPSDKISPFLHMNVQVRDKRGRLMDQDRDVDALRVRLQQRGSSAFEEQFKSDLEERGLTTFPKTGLPSTTVKRVGEGEVLLYPTLIDRGDSVDLKFEYSPVGQTQKNLQGLCRLALLKDASSAKYLKQELNRETNLVLHYATIGTKAQLLDSLLLGAARYSFFRADRWPQSADEFEERLLRSRGELVRRGLELIVIADEVLERRFAVGLAAGELTSAAFAVSRADIETHLARLVPSDFLFSTPPSHLAELKRYLDGLAYRISHLSGNVLRDRQGIEVLNEWETRLSRIAETRETGADLSRLQFLLEEFRVSLFAQPVGAREKISEKRLEKTFEEYEMRTR